ncbi:hypothetical protein O9993_16310 [Vibrio lentus]|nr:hypothetical protein [Vibrio lentus]
MADKPGMPAFMPNLDLEAAAILVESHASSQQDLNLVANQFLNALTEYTIVESVPFTSDQRQSQLCGVFRKGMFPAVGAVH